MAREILHRYSLSVLMAPNPTPDTRHHQEFPTHQDAFEKFAHVSYQAFPAVFTANCQTWRFVSHLTTHCDHHAPPQSTETLLSKLPSEDIPHDFITAEESGTAKKPEAKDKKEGK